MSPWRTVGVLFTAFAVMATGGVAAACGDKNDSDYRYRQITKTEYGNGVWLVGVNISPGDYAVREGADCVWRLYEEFPDNMAGYGMYAEGEVLTILSDAPVVEFQGSCLWERIHG